VFLGNEVGVAMRFVQRMGALRNRECYRRWRTGPGPPVTETVTEAAGGGSVARFRAVPVPSGSIKVASVAILVVPGKGESTGHGPILRRRVGRCSG